MGHPPGGRVAAAGRADRAHQRGEGHWHIWAPLRFTDFTIFVIVQELPDGTRVLNEAVRIWPAETGRRPEQLGWPDVEIHYRPGTRHPESAVLHLMQRGQRPVKVELKTLGIIPLHVGRRIRRRPDLVARQLEGRRLGRGA